MRNLGYKGLIIDRENSNRVLKHHGKKVIGYPIRRFRPIDSDEVITGVGKEPSRSYILTNYKTQEERFLSLKGRPIQKRYKENAEYKSRSTVITEKKINGYETGEGDPRETDTAPLQIDVDTISSGESTERIIATMIMLWKAMSILNRDYGCKCKVVVNESGERTLDFKLSNFPMLSSWATVNDSDHKRSRQALWIEIEKNGRWFYVVEWERRRTEQFGIYFMKFINGLQASNEELQLVMENWAINKDERKSDGLGRGWERESVKHPKSYITERLPWMIAERIYWRLY